MFYSDKCMAVFDTDLSPEPEIVCNDANANKYEKVTRTIHSWFVAEGNLASASGLMRHILKAAQKSVEPNFLLRFFKRISGDTHFTLTPNQNVWSSIHSLVASTTTPLKVWDDIVAAAVEFRGNRAKGYVGAIPGNDEDQALAAARLQIAACLQGQPIRPVKRT